jgi:sensor histidine kinase YesM
MYSFTARITVLALFAFCSVLYFAFMQSIGLSKLNAAIDSISLFILIAGFGALIRLIQNYFHSKSPLNLPNMSTIVLFGTLLMLVNHFSSLYFFSGEADQTHILRYAFLPKSIFILFLLALILIYHWSRKQKTEMERINQRTIEKEREALKIQLNSLQQQFQPHFLFNSLNSINALTISNPAEAQRMIQLLSEFMRGNIRENQAELVPLQEEIRHLQLYTDIKKVRFGDRLSIVYDISKELLDYNLPHLILQPMIENAIKYGLYGSIDAVEIQIAAFLDGNQLVIRMSNPFDPTGSAGAKGTGYGLQSIEKKMQIIYRQAHLLSVRQEDNLFITELTIPQL